MISWFRRRPICALSAIGVVIAGSVAALFFLPGALASWQQRRLLTSARAFFERGDFRSAMISCRQLIQLNPNQREAYPILIAIGEESNSPQALTWASKLVEVSHHDPRALSQLAALALKFGEVEFAQEALNQLPAASKETATALSLQATVDVVQGSLIHAEALFDRAARLEPSNVSHRLNSLKIQMQLGDPVKAEAARHELEELAENPYARSEALRALLQDARAHSRSERALSIAEQLASIPDASISDNLLLLDELRVSGPDRFQVALANLRQKVQSSGNRGLIFQVLSWQNRHGMYLESLTWKEQLPAAVAAGFPIALAESEALMGLQDWGRLRTKVAAADWGQMNYLRLAIYSRAERELSNGQFQERWESALVATAGEWNALLELANLAERWDWEDQAVQVFWIIARQSQGQNIALRRLYKFYSDQRNTRELYKVAKRILEVNPNDLIAMNNVAALGLLLGEDRDQALKLAEEVYSKAPSIPAFAATYAFAMLKAGQSNRAFEIIKDLPSKTLEDPSIALYYALVLAAHGQSNGAELYLENALRNGHLFPEEESLARQALVP